MSYKTIVVHVDSSSHADARMHHAARLAATFDAHLVGSAFSGLSRYAGSEVSIDLAIMAPQEYALIGQRNEAALARFEAIAAGEGVNSVERRLMEDDPAGGLALQARYADLVVVSQTDLDEPASIHLIGGLPEQVVLDGGRPVLILPYAGQFARIGSKVLVAWDGSLEATHAVYNALPLLRSAALVSVVEFNRGVARGREPGADLALYLARQGVRCAVRCAVEPIRDGESLLSQAADLQADLIVMGGYGHSRFREIMLGGVTETVLASMTVPVLMSH
jgi:nucleotide-binding universal stress UspA family protein